METVKHFPTFLRQKVGAQLMLTVWVYMTPAEKIMSTGIAMLLCLRFVDGGLLAEGLFRNALGYAIRVAMQT